MKDFKDLTTEDLKKMDKNVLITIIGSLQGQLKSISGQLDFLTEQIALMNQRTFGRKTEKVETMNQLTLDDYMDDVFNEPEAMSDDSKEPEITEVIVSSYTRKTKTKREEKLEGLPARIFEHKLSEEELKKLFPNGYKELPPYIYKRLAVIPQTFLVDEHHVHIYASKTNDGTMVKADRPPDLFENSIATASLLAMLITGKYQNHLPLTRQAKVFLEGGIKLEDNTLANWMINASDDYLLEIYNEMHKQLYKAHVVHADETPFNVIHKSDPDAGKKSYMWVYRNGKAEKSPPIVLFDYEPGRHHYHPLEFLKDFSGILVTDGYQAYHALERLRSDLRVAGCWIHAKRKFADLVKAVGADKVSGTISAKAVKKISKMFHLDNQLDDLSCEERLKQRQQVLKPLVDDYFAWLKETLATLPAESNTARAINYSLNQEKFLRVFLDDGNVPMDNNRAEQAIRPFTLGRKNWVNMTSERGADASAVLYSIVETAKANNLRVFEYINLLLTELPAHKKDKDRSFIKDLMPWSEHVQEKCHNLQKS